jgi:hypothetical protein
VSATDACLSVLELDGRDALRFFGPAQNKGVSPFELTPCLVGGARRDRTVDLYNAIVKMAAFLLLPRISSSFLKLTVPLFLPIVGL